MNEGVNAQNDYDFGFATWTTLLSYRHFDMNWVYPTNPGQGPAAVAPDGISFPPALEPTIRRRTSSKAWNRA